MLRSAAFAPGEELLVSAARRRTGFASGRGDQCFLVAVRESWTATKRVPNRGVAGFRRSDK